MFLVFKFGFGEAVFGVLSSFPTAWNISLVECEFWKEVLWSGLEGLLR